MPCYSQLFHGEYWHQGAQIYKLMCAGLHAGQQLLISLEDHPPGAILLPKQVWAECFCSTAKASCLRGEFRLRWWEEGKQSIKSLTAVLHVVSGNIPLCECWIVPAPEGPYCKLCSSRASSQRNFTIASRLTITLLPDTITKCAWGKAVCRNSASRRSPKLLLRLLLAKACGVSDLSIECVGPLSMLALSVPLIAQLLLRLWRPTTGRRNSSRGTLREDSIEGPGLDSCVSHRQPCTEIETEVCPRCPSL